MFIPSNSSIGLSGNINLNPNANHSVKNPGESISKAPGKQSSPAECEACSTRKYMDVSDESVSFQTPTHISPEDSFQRVSAHEKGTCKQCLYKSILRQRKSGFCLCYSKQQNMPRMWQKLHFRWRNYNTN
jgi:hypothetical protein